MSTNKQKIINDPVYGFITLPFPLFFDVLEHPFVQRLRRVSQLGLSSTVYPGATHNRFQHALGAAHLMGLAVESLRGKGVAISPDEEQAVTLAILLHDLGHWPFSHTLEHSLASGVSHEQISLLLMERLDRHFKGALRLAIRIFTNQHEKPFLHNLVSGQLDLDRLDYLARDSFFTGVSEGVVGVHRIIKMLNVHKGQLVVEAKGIYSIENFLIARRLMYWQVYLHKTVVAAELMLMQVMARAKQIMADEPDSLWATPALSFFLSNELDAPEQFEQAARLPNGRQTSPLDLFAQLDDSDIWAALKVWQDHADPVLSLLSRGLLTRRLLRLEIHEEPSSKRRKRLELLRRQAWERWRITPKQAELLVFEGELSNKAYSFVGEKINILQKDGSLRDVAKASDISNITALAKNVTKFYLCYPKELEE